MTQYPLTYLRLLVRMLKLDDQQQQQLLEGTALKPSYFEQLDGVVTQDDIATVFANLKGLTDKEYLGLSMGERMSLASHGPLGQLLSAGASPAEAWSMIGKYSVLRMPFISISCEQNKQNYIFNIQVAQELKDEWVIRFLLDSIAINILRSIELILGRRLKEAQVALAVSEPADPHKATEYLPCEISYGTEHSRVLVPLDIMQMPNPYRDSLLWEQAVKLCVQLYESSQGLELSLERRIRQLLQEQMGRLWSMEEVSAHFNMSSRTMIRRLKSEGTRYQCIVDAELEKQAKTYLMSAGHNVESVAYALGYNDTSAFRRAFRRWCGMSPTEWQDSMRQP